jgi:sulfur-oxidizing protein SoxY
MGGGLPAPMLAAEWPRNAFNADNVADALKAIYGTSSTNDSNAITIKPPTETANGAAVLVSVSTTLPGVDSIAVIVDDNPQPFVVRMSFTGAEPYTSASVKVSKISRIQAIVPPQGKVLSNHENRSRG